MSEGLLYHYFPTKDALLVAAVQRAADALREALDGALADGSPSAAVLSGLAAFLDHVQADPTGWRAVLQARSGALADIGDEVERHGRAVLLLALGVEEPSPILAAVLDSWSAFERQVCLAWIEEPTISRQVVEELLVGTMRSALTAVAGTDQQAAAVLRSLADDAGTARRES